MAQVTFKGKAPKLTPALWIGRKNLLKAFLAGGMTVYIKADKVEGEVWFPRKKHSG